MTHVRLLCLFGAGAMTLAGIAAAAAFGLNGAPDQAVAFSWPAIGAAVMLALAAPRRAARQSKPPAV